jgi:hypothetical protein
MGIKISIVTPNTASIQAPPAKFHKNPVLTASEMLRQLSKSDSKILTSAWELFKDYYISVCDKDYSLICDQIKTKAGRFSKKILGKPIEYLTDEDIEAAVILFTILSNDSPEKKQLEKFLAAAFNYYIEESKRAADISSSPILSKCIGLSYVVIDQLEEKALLSKLKDRCEDSNMARYFTFCTYSYFAEALKIYMNRDKSQAERELKRIENWIERYIKQRSPSVHLSALNMLTYGLIAEVAQKWREEVKIKLFEKILIDLDVSKPRFLTKSTWIIVELALLANHLQSIHYVSGDNIIISQNQSKEILNVLSSLESFLERKYEIISSTSSLAVSIIGFIMKLYETFTAPSLQNIVAVLLFFIILVLMSGLTVYLIGDRKKTKELQQQLKNLKEFFKSSERKGSNESEDNVE